MKNISTKELNYINDFLSWELLSAKKCYQYCCQESSSTHRQIFCNCANMHQENYQHVLNYINQVNLEKGGQLS